MQQLKSTKNIATISYSVDGLASSLYPKIGGGAHRLILLLHVIIITVTPHHHIYFDRKRCNCGMDYFTLGGFEAWALLGDSGESKETVFVRSRNNLIGSFIELEDPDSEEVKDFVKKKVELTESVLKKCETREADKYFYFHNSGLQPQKVMYMQDSLDGKAEVLLDPNGLSEDGTVALRTYVVSEDAKYLAYALSSSGSDRVTVKVMRIDDKKVEPDTLSWVKFSGISWTNDSKGFFYSRYPAPKQGDILDSGTETNVNLDHQLYYHFLGTDQSEDILCCMQLQLKVKLGNYLEPIFVTSWTNFCPGIETRIAATTELITINFLHNTKSMDNQIKHLVYLMEIAMLNLPKGQERDGMVD
ncbi:prolyl oligopeptidase family protein [Artemisia annua]|uniref:Prolyl oligopeptidase family protein n=1 Tax=Artemisia annua TaxID=35608 RepID=A0A2U1NXE6_ARTAN|nr:prolyl oligopeptidase family protein [Artemisia annua]